MGQCAGAEPGERGPYPLRLVLHLHLHIDARDRAPEVGITLSMEGSATLLGLLSQGLLHAGLLCEPQPRGGLSITERFIDRLVLVSTEPPGRESPSPRHTRVSAPPAGRGGAAGSTVTDALPAR